MDHLDLIRLAAQLLTRFPVTKGVDYTPEKDAQSVGYYPAIGLLVGIVAAAAFAAMAALLNPALAAVAAVAVAALVTGGLHEDGLADTADGIGGGQTRERALEIMRDSRIGVYGAIALILVLVGKIMALASMPLWLGAAALIAGHGLSRWSMVLVMATADYQRESGAGTNVAGKVSVPSHVIAGTSALIGVVLVAVIVSPLAALGALVGLLVAHGLVRAFFQPKLKGYTGDCLGATQQISELGVYLGVLAGL